ncbi:response regulator transcription factor [Paenibacillus hamazuiensis]|uniref:response regulator transcription factor n=1 Tax=Paenibacillus hamazuiensis TaxID=2936508 RepID=UPI00200E3B0A|nr:response regulator [Paenibacillus hamazuiensis]
MIRILLVEDEEVIREGISSLIRQVSPHFTVVKEAAHGREALDYLSRNVVDVVITDIRMREMNGLQLLEKIREKYEDMPLLIISGYSDFSYAQKALQFGVSDYLLKPIDRKQLVCALDKIHALLLKRGGKSPVPAQAEEAPPAMQPGTEGRRLIRKVKEYIEAHPEGDLRLQTLADFVHLNPAYLSQLFKQETGANLSDAITAARMERAKYLLAHTELKIYDVARLSGYQSPKHFMLVFKQWAGVTPGTYREQHAT